jgi:hypothetical protein
MKLKAPEGVGDPCVAGAPIAARNGLYDVEAAIGALLIECFGFIEAGVTQQPAAVESSAAVAAAAPPRRRAPAKKA